MVSSYNCRKYTVVPVHCAGSSSGEPVLKDACTGRLLFGIALHWIRMNNRHVPLIIGGICIGAAIWLLLGVTGWWRFIVGPVLLFIGWPALKTGLFASAKEIDELTGTGAMSDETAQKFKDRI